MSNPAQHEAVGRDLDHGLGDIETLFIVAHQMAPPGHPTKGARDDPALWQNLEPGLFVGPSDDLEDEVLVSGGIHQACAVTLLEISLSATARLGPLPKLESRHGTTINPFSNGLLESDCLLVTPPPRFCPDILAPDGTLVRLTSARFHNRTPTITV